MGVTIRRSFPALTDVEYLTLEDWRAIGQLARERILRRTRQGTDVQGAPFAPYSPGYLLRKDREVGALGAGGYGRVNLTLSGAMLDAIHVVPSKNKVQLTFTN